MSKPTYEELEKQLAESVAHCAYQLKTIQALDDESNAWGVVLADNLYDYLSISIRDNPKHSLLLHDADVIDKFLNKVDEELGYDYGIMDFGCNYIDQLTLQAKEGVK